MNGAGAGLAPFVVAPAAHVSCVEPDAGLVVASDDLYPAGEVRNGCGCVPVQARIVAELLPVAASPTEAAAVLENHAGVVVSGSERNGRFYAGNWNEHIRSDAGVPVSEFTVGVGRAPAFDGPVVEQEAGDRSTEGDVDDILVVAKGSGLHAEAPAPTLESALDEDRADGTRRSAELVDRGQVIGCDRCPGVGLVSCSQSVVFVVAPTTDGVVLEDGAAESESHDDLPRRVDLVHGHGHE